MKKITVKLFKEEAKKYYARIFFFFMISIVLTILILSTVLYKSFEKIAQTKIYNSERQSLSQTSYSADILTESAKTLMMQLYGDKQLQKLFFLSDPEDIELNEGIRRLITYQSAASFIHSIYVYNPSTGLFYVSVASNSCNAYARSAFFDKEIIEILDNFKNYKMFYPIPRDIPLPTSIDNPIFNKGYTYLFYEPSSSGSGLDYAIVINISESWLRKTVNNLDTVSDNNTFIIDHKGNTIISSRKNAALSNIYDKEYVKNILNFGTDSGYFVDYVDGTRALIIYSFHDDYDWVFIRTIPYDTVMNEITEMKNKTILIAMLILLVGIFGAFFISRYLYKPINRLISKLKSLESERRNNLYILKQNLLRSIIYGKSNTNPAYIQSHFNSLNIKLGCNGIYFIILLVIDGYEDYASKLKPNDLSLYKYAIMNIASEIFGQNMNIECVDMENAHIAMCINLDSPSAMPPDDELKEKIRVIQESVEKHLSISISAVISTTGESLSSLNKLYNEVQQASYYRLYYGYKSIIFASIINTFSLSDYSYPLQKEKLLIEALMLGKSDNMKSVFDDIMKNAIKYPYTTFHLTITHLAFAINSAIDTIEKSSGKSMDYDFNSFITILNRCETIDDIIKHFQALFDFIAAKLDERRESKYSDLMSTIMDIINNEYMRPDLTLESIADRVNMSHVYLGRLFKKLSSMSIVDYINDFRMKKAAEFLTTTNKPIAAIVECTGFTNSQYFYKLFKRTYGVTPNEFRQNSASQKAARKL